MATSKNKKQGNGRILVGGGNSSNRVLSRRNVVDDSEGSDGSLGILIAMLSMAIVLFLLVLTALMYIDVLGAKAEVKEQLIKLEKLRVEVQKLTEKGK